ncbi:MAG TPA: DUF1697 domain-containing protein [Caulobacteraceae bacterium]|jgi:uncharacterized protein (DUF1697 family)
MASRIALLRGVNLGKARRVLMADVRAVFESLGWREVRSLGQSGNLVFAADGADDGELEAAAEQALLASLTLTTEVVVRRAEAWRAMIAANPFPNEAVADPSHLVAMVLKSEPRPDAEAAMAAVPGRERARVVGRAAYIVYPDGIAGVRLIGATLDKALGARGTGRNWNTVVKLAALAAAPP